MNATNAAGETALHTARDSSVVTTLLACSAQPMLVDTTNRTAVETYAIDDNEDALSAFLDAVKPAVDLNCQFPSGWTLLARACQADTTSASTLELLLTRGADPNVQCIGGATALHEAMRRGNHDAGRLLLRHGAQLGICNEDGLTPVDEAIFFLLSNRSTVDGSLLYDGVDSPAKSLSHATLKAQPRPSDMSLLDVPNPPTQKFSHPSRVPALVKLLLDTPQCWSTRNQHGVPALLLAYHYVPSLVHRVLESGSTWPELGVSDSHGCTLFYLAASFGDVDVVRLLLARGVAAAIRPSPALLHSGRPISVLEAAARFGNEDIMLSVIKQGVPLQVGELDAELVWNEERLLGSGQNADVFAGRVGNRAVAVKRLRGRKQDMPGVVCFFREASLARCASRPASHLLTKIGLRADLFATPTCSPFNRPT